MPKYSLIFKRNSKSSDIIKTATPVCSCRSMIIMMVNMVMNIMMVIILTKTSVAPVCASTHEEVHGVARTESLPLQCRFDIIGDWNDQYCVVSSSIIIIIESPSLQCRFNITTFFYKW